MTAPVPATDARPRSAQSSLNTRVLGGLLLVFGSGWMLKQAGVLDLPWSAVVSTILIALGLALVVTARSGARTVPLVLLGAALTVGLAIGSSNIDVRGGFGERVLHPPVLTSSQRYRLGFGELQLDLRKTEIQPGLSVVRADISAGHLLVRVPKGVGVKVDVRAQFGSANVFGKQLDIHGHASDTVTTEGFDTAERQIHLVLKAGFGQIDVST
jgi:uncharacterized protein YceK